MCVFKNITRPLVPVYSKALFHTTIQRGMNMEPINMNYSLYENTENAKSGSSTPPLMIMHGLFGSKTNWNYLGKALHQKTVPQRTVISVDARNHGESPHSINHTYEHLAEDVRFLLNKMNIQKSALLGHSMGGRAMMYFALKYPNLVDRLIVGDVSPISTSPTFLTSMPHLFSIMENVKLPTNIPISAARLEVNKKLSKNIDDNGLRAFLVSNLIQNADGSIAWRINLEVLKTNFASHIAQFPQVSDMKYEGPVLFLAGEKSDFLRESDHSKILELFPKAKFQIIRGAGHWLHSEKPTEFLQQTLEFLNT